MPKPEAIFNSAKKESNLRKCDMAGLPLVTPKPATVPRPFKFQTDKRAHERSAKKAQVPLFDPDSTNETSA